MTATTTPPPASSPPPTPPGAVRPTATRAGATRPRASRARRAVVLAALALTATAGAHAAGAQAAPAAAPAAPAAVPAIPGVDCKSPPDPTGDDLGPLGALDPGPAHPRTGDPFGPAPTTGRPTTGPQPVSAYEAYGYAGLRWTSYDLGCGPDGARAPVSTGWGMAADLTFFLLQVATAFVVAITRLAFDPATLSLFDPVQRLAADALGGRVFLALIWVALALTGITMLARAHRQRVPEAAGTAGWAVAVLMLATAAITWPLTIAPKVDQAVTGVVSTVNNALARGGSASGADGAAANLHRAVLYETWRAGTFGRASTRTANTYGPALFKASGLSREETRRTAADPAARKRLITHKKDQYQQTARRIEAEDPQAYEWLAGRHNLERFFYALLGLVGLVCATAFQGVAAFLMLYGLIAVRVAIMVLPVVALVAVHPAGRPHLIKILDLVAGALVTAVTFGTISAAFVAAIGGFLAPNGINPVLAMVLLLIASTVLWRLTTPLRRLRHMNDVRDRFTRLRRHLDQDPVKAAPGSQTATAASTPPTAPHEATPGRGPGLAAAAARGAAGGGAASAAAGLVTGGTTTAGAAATGATRAAVTHTRTGRRATSAPTVPGDVRVFAPGEKLPGPVPTLAEPLTDPTTGTTTGTTVYPIFTPPTTRTHPTANPTASTAGGLPPRG